MDETRWTAREAAKLQLIAEAYRVEVQGGTEDTSMEREADALDRLAARLLSGVGLRTAANPIGT